MCVCVYVRRPAAWPTQPITLKFGMGSSFHPGTASIQGATPNVDPWGYPYSDPVWKTLKGKELGGGQQTIVAPRGGFSM